MTAITQVRGSGGMFGLRANLPFSGEAWHELRSRDLAGRVAAINDQAFAARLLEEARRENSSWIDMAHVYYLGAGASPDFSDGPANNLQAIAAAAGEHCSETFLRLSRETKGRAIFNFHMYNRNLKALGGLLKSERCFPGLGDAGAYVSEFTDAGWATFVLSYWVRQTGLYTLPEAIRRMTSGPARIIGLKDRGTLAVGQRADINVFDADNVAERQLEIVHDFPRGAPRFIERSVGYKATIVNGKVNVLDGQHTGIRAGQVIRHGR